MTHLSKLSFKTVERSVQQRDPVLERRTKIMAAIDEQKLVLAAKLKGDIHYAEKPKWMTNEQGERVLVTAQRQVKPWFFQQDGGWYVQCRYGARVVLVDGKNNAVFVKDLKDVATVLDAVSAAVNAGELDTVLAQATQRKARA